MEILRVTIFVAAVIQAREGRKSEMHTKSEVLERLAKIPDGDRVWPMNSRYKPLPGAHGAGE